MIKLLLFALLLSQVSFAQIKKPTTKQVAPQIKLDSLNLVGLYRSDTSKVAILLFAEDGSIFWKRGFEINRNFYYTDRNYLPYSKIYTDEKFIALRKEELESIADVKPFAWK